MYYRYEAEDDDGQYVGIFSFFDPSQRRYFNRFLKEPKWYKSNSNKESRCWFTEIGYQKYHNIIDELIAETGNIKTRLLTAEKLDNIVVKGKIQCIELVSPLDGLCREA